MEKIKVWLFIASGLTAAVLFAMGSPLWIIPALPYLVVVGGMSILFIGLTLFMANRWMNDRVWKAGRRARKISWLFNLPIMILVAIVAGGVLRWMEGDEFKQLCLSVFTIALITALLFASIMWFLKKVDQA